MNDLSPLRLWLMRAGFVLLVVVILFFHLLPLETSPRRWAAPDLILGFACAWSLRRPEYVPAVSLAAMFLLTDLLFQRPPGLWAVLALLGCEYLKSSGRGLRDSGFVSEWLTVSGVIIVIAAANRLILAILLVDMPPLGLTLFETGNTLLFYPVMVLVTHGLMGIRKSAPGDLDGMGKRV
ncbi:hypothetical protein [Roseobacter sp. GAI101]|uniref:hypothetical protein n=1 Tax=Roseobacter sp. (strain GAI101) TaxID=391589 RepID=UPI0001872136|nr:hypothetical protein [Roseobacter sp. GAI101]EEB83741.1 MreD protein [Roseobacter sp. GAI101]